MLLSFLWLPAFGSLFCFLCTMENEKFLNAIESFLFRGLDERIKTSPDCHARKKPKGLKAQLDYTQETAYAFLQGRGLQICHANPVEYAGHHGAGHDG